MVFYGPMFVGMLDLFKEWGTADFVLLMYQTHLPVDDAVFTFRRISKFYVPIFGQSVRPYRRCTSDKLRKYPGGDQIKNE